MLFKIFNLLGYTYNSIWKPAERRFEQLDRPILEIFEARDQR